MDNKLIQRLEVLQAETTKLLDGLRAGDFADNCNCGRFREGTCAYHATTNNVLYDFERELKGEIVRLKEGEGRD